MKSDFRHMFKLFHAVKRTIPVYIISCISVASRNYVITLLTAYMGAEVLEHCASGDFVRLGPALCVFSIYLVLFLLFDAVANYAYSQTLDRIRCQIRFRIYQNILRAPLPDVSAIGQEGELLSRMNRDADTAVNCFQSLLMPLMFL